jgi:3-oxoacyl-[acyl-carrier-protein] synthase III
VKLLFQDKKITGNLVVLPAHEQDFLEDMKEFHAPEARSRKLKEVMGYDKHRLVAGNECVSDLVVFGFEHLFRENLLGKDDFDALILVTQSPDHFVPATSNIIQGRLGLKQDLLCLDINQGCAGFIIGLMQAFLWLEQTSIRRVVVVSADVMSRKVSRQDRNSYPLAGDAIAITLVENSPGSGPIHGALKMDGTRHQALMIPAGGFRMPSTPETAIPHDSGEGNVRALDNLVMDGSGVFNFVMVDVPPLIEELFKTAGVTDADVDAYAFHQPNRFMLQKLADKMGVAHAKMPMDIVGRFGNSSGVTIPTVLAHSLGERLCRESLRLCLSGFGVGLTWAALLIKVGPLRFCSRIDYPDGGCA